MNFSGTYTANDLISANWVHLQPRRSVGIAGLILLVLALLSSWMLFFTSIARGAEWTRWVIPGGLLYLGLTFGVGIPYKCRRAYKQRKDLQRLCNYSASDAGLAFSSEGVAGTKPWTDYLKWKEGSKVFLIYMSDQLYQVMPKRFFSSESDVDAFRELLSRKIQRRVN